MPQLRVFMKTQSSQRKKDLKKERKNHLPTSWKEMNKMSYYHNPLHWNTHHTVKIALAVWLGTAEMTRIIFFFSFSSSKNFGLEA